MAWLGWHTQRPEVLILLALIWRSGRTPERFSALLAYYLVLANGIPDAYRQFFPDHPGWHGIGWWLLQAVVLASPALIFRKPWGWTACLVLAAIPPWAMISWGSPLLAAGWWFPGGGMAGLLAMLILNYLLAAGQPGSPWQTSLAAGMLLWALILHMHEKEMSLRLPPGWVALNTHSGRFSADPVQNVIRQQKLMRRVDQAINRGAKVVLLPESSANIWTEASEYWWGGVIRHAAQQQAVVLIGASQKLPSGQWQDVMLLRGNQTGTVHSRVPIPLGLWNPFSQNAFTADWLSSGEFHLQGQRVAASFCYEDLLLFPLLRSEWHARPAILLSMADDWFAAHSDESRLQTFSIGLQARLYGLPLLRALDDHYSAQLAPKAKSYHNHANRDNSYKFFLAGNPPKQALGSIHTN